MPSEKSARKRGSLNDQGTFTLAALAVFLLALVLGTTLAVPLACGSSFGYSDGGVMGVGMGGTLLAVLFFVLLVGGVAWLVQALRRGNRTFSVALRNAARHTQAKLRQG